MTTENRYEEGWLNRDLEENRRTFEIRRIRSPLVVPATFSFEIRLNMVLNSVKVDVWRLCWTSERKQQEDPTSMGFAFPVRDKVARIWVDLVAMEAVERTAQEPLAVGLWAEYSCKVNDQLMKLHHAVAFNAKRSSSRRKWFFQWKSQICR